MAYHQHCLLWYVGPGLWDGDELWDRRLSLIPAQNVSSNAPSADHIDFASLQTGISQALCLNPSVNTISGLIYFNQF